MPGFEILHSVSTPGITAATVFAHFPCPLQVCSVQKITKTPKNFYLNHKISFKKSKKNNNIRPVVTKESPGFAGILKPPVFRHPLQGRNTIINEGQKMLNFTSDGMNQNRAAMDSTNFGVRNTENEPQSLASKYTINPFCDNISISVIHFLNDNAQNEPSNIYDQVIQEVEKSLFVRILKYVSGNQTKAARIMGINRGTLRKKLKKYGISG